MVSICRAGEDCTAPATRYDRTLCERHGRRRDRHGDPGVVKTAGRPRGRAVRLPRHWTPDAVERVRAAGWEPDAIARLQRVAKSI